MFRLRREMDFMDENKAIDIHTSFLKRKHGKHITPIGIDFVKSCCKVKHKDILKKLSYCKVRDKDMLKKLEDIPIFKPENECIRINNVLAIIYIAHKTKLEFLW